MGRIELEELRKRRRNQIVLLSEVADLTSQLQQAVDRNDQVSVQILLSMRETPIRQLQELETGLQDYLLTLPEAEAIRYHALLRGEEEAESTDEEALRGQTAQFRRTLEALIAADKQLSLRLGGSQSFYQKFRE